MNADKGPILGQEERGARGIEGVTGIEREGRSDGDRSLQEGLIRWMGTRLS